MVRMLVFLAVATSIMLLGHAYVAWRLIGPSPLSPPARTLAWTLALASVLVYPAGFVVRFALNASWGDRAAWASFIFMGLFSLVFTLVVMRDLGWLAAKAGGALPSDPTRRAALLHTMNLGILMASGGLGAFGWYEVKKRVGVVDVTIPVRGLPQALEGFRIAQITDVHVGPTIKRGFIEEIVAQVNAIDADLVAVTGDIVDGSVADLGAHTEPLRNMRSKHGTFFVTGNHEYYSGVLPWLEEFARLGMRTLVDEHAIIEHNGCKVLVGGVADYSARAMQPDHLSDPGKCVERAPPVDLRLLLAHQPRSAFEAAKAGFHVQLSGHTHGGQMFPWNFLVRLVQPFAVGLHSHQDLMVYTSRGTGYWGPPMRVGVPAEITRVTLARA